MIQSEYSLLDGANRIADISMTAKNLGMSSVSVTDHGTLSGLLAHYNACKANGIKPLLGIETYLSENPDNMVQEEKVRDNFHMILIAANEKGWKNLMKLSSNSFSANFYYKPRIFLDNLNDNADGLIGSSACLASILCRKATYDEINNAYWDPDHKVEQLINQFGEIFKGNYFLELMYNPNSPQQNAYNEFLIHLAKKTGRELVITSDAHFTKKEDQLLHSTLMALQSKQSLEEYNKSNTYFNYDGCYIKSPQEMLDAARAIGAEEAFHNTNKIASMINLELKTDGYKIPLYDITKDKDYGAFCIHKS